ncbi:TolC family protein [Thermosulfurimonas sp.]|uniref:TolC family protein n=1 Tax=Thermosulfurimonas sp. TaxID=2080236 RepID=UPI0025D28954|nr:TolC family protein [Thermosulfurimonas sp.]
MRRNTVVFLVLLLLWSPGIRSGIAGTENSSLSFPAVLELVFAQHPALKTFREREKAVRFEAAQASRLKNPELSFTFEDVFGSGEFSGMRSSETTLEISQSLPLFGQREKRREAILAREKVLEAAGEEARLLLFRETALAFIETLYARHRATLYEELLSLSRKLLAVSEAKFLAGKIPETEKIRAEIVVADTETRLRNAREAYRSALRRLARLWGGTPPSDVRGDFFRRKDFFLRALPKDHPRLKRFRAEMQRLEKEIERARAEALPEITFSSGVRFYNESDERAFVFGLSLPLPLLNRNLDRMASLQQKITATKLALRAERWNLSREMERVRSELRRAEEKIRTLERQLLPRARDIYRRNLEAYRLGKTEFLRVLDAQRTLFELRLSRLEAYRRYHRLQAEALFLMARIEKDLF